MQKGARQSFAVEKHSKIYGHGRRRQEPARSLNEFPGREDGFASQCYKKNKFRLDPINWRQKIFAVVLITPGE